ncbi:hypothetical protein TSTA_024780 [Talaromyces stipitatus ATCC 10500]|uniref:NACHT-NTPase and P-loop NTPases N-terminal domain-containing protein n=1 Tax=Talaromyces stipitatus (strain ATCC 10500 / CBS 375.48 / QM 6759 / NRRL 1006) TaxID=441959 RepID=B8M4G1_TALSN|nr:uncharacterized protein TSTA_024780 [Talaromyces stipitatus ATCC 10500]EED19156.1 hypothetical protein TSTA_024780 [Talaromyces stipitatus ATCC 10500]
MAFQISIGDILMLSKLAWDISQEFTSGRKSAPAGFQEVQNQLISLTHALESLKSLSSETSGQEDGDSFNSITPILQNCRFTLEHLEALVSKYMIIVKDDGLDESEKNRWREELQKNWKKEESLKLSFSLYRGDDGLFETAPLCDNASFNVDWLRGPDEDKPVFKCNCQLRRTTYGDIHDEELGQYLVMENIMANESIPAHLPYNPKYNPIWKAWNRGAASLMAYPSINPYTKLPVISVLNMLWYVLWRVLTTAFLSKIYLSETGRLYGKIETVKFTANGRSYSTGPIEAVQMVHFRNLTETLAWSFNEAADLMLDARLDIHNSDSIEDEAVEYTITGEPLFTPLVTRMIELNFTSQRSDANYTRRECISQSGQENMVKGVGVEIELPDINSAIYFVQQLNSLQEGLLGVRTQELLRNEKLVCKM